MSVGSEERRRKAQQKVRELVKQGHRLNEENASETYREAASQKHMGRGTGHSAEKTANRIKRGK